MGTTDLDDQLSSMTEPLPQAADLEARHMAAVTVPSRVSKRRALRPRWVLPAVVSAAVLVTAGAGTAAVMMSHWGGVSMPLENVRSTEPIPVTWVTGTGHEETCRAWIELRNPSPGDIAKLDSAIYAHDWAGLGQRLYDAAGNRTDDPEGEARVNGSLAVELQHFAKETFPGINWLNGGGHSTDRTVDAWGMTCAPEAK
ncbi:hypothetical protein PSET11_02041 [Arthrobacter ulcerisalmonis]|uniref:Uncharacterized protein n=1 Tax=Arthrobacter ulcerisalmonis TaxID=2483813 RepID=A0A3P5XGL0_9MICC|nr:hypothetical protein [Arthrobacter ulcerisalmonis]VDC27759.1 hypothetical protein PSET11_02041 [Arthrobacter ulcerisalmonis]